MYTFELWIIKWRFAWKYFFLLSHELGYIKVLNASKKQSAISITRLNADTTTTIWIATLVLEALEKENSWILSEPRKVAWIKEVISDTLNNFFKVYSVYEEKLNSVFTKMTWILHILSDKLIGYIYLLLSFEIQYAMKSKYAH